MKNSFKSKCKHNNKILSIIVFITILFVISFTFFLLQNFNKKTNNNLIEITSAEINKVIYSFITDKLNNSILNTETLSDVLIINKNKNDEILYVDFDLDKAYKILDNVSNTLTSSLKKIENGEISVKYYDDLLSHNSNSLILSIPIGNILNSVYFYNLGPKIPVKINFVGSVLTNLETKVTNYGLNNALVEMFVYIEFHTNIIAPFKTEELILKYDAVIASMMIEGKVPSFYNGVLESKSNIHNETIN
ncbi:MAG: sporulation protein YunB [Firmicutes bacterium]|nr:sporulation protein YunB [Bacillota bacterium]